MKKINIFLFILIFVIGGVILFKQLAPEPDETLSPSEPVGEQREVGLAEPKSPEETKLSEAELQKHIKSKMYLESTFMALEYSKVNNVEMMSNLKGYLDDNSKMKKEDVVKLIDIHEKTFLNRYLKVFVSSPDPELNELNSKMRRIFYQMKVGFDTLDTYGTIPVEVPTTEPTGEGDVPPEGEAISEDAAPAPAGNQPTSLHDRKKPAEPKFDNNDLQLGIQQLEQVAPLVEEALKELGIQDIKIEKAWLRAGISESDITGVIDKSNAITPTLEGDSVESESAESVSTNP